ncbi:MAG: protein-PII uridylyltransferase [SAR324 cluster bacterium]|nr:protein-PII uridylyltransferase [SAR324 cluster bacterium]
MKNLYSPVEIYPFLQQLCLLNQIEKRDHHTFALKERLKSRQNEEKVRTEKPPLSQYTSAKEQIFQDITYAYFQEETKEIAKANLESENSFEILAMKTHLVDSIIHVAFDFVLEDLPLLKDTQIQDAKNELNLKQRNLPGKEEKLSILSKHIEELESQQEEESRQMEIYYQGIRKSLLEEIEEYREKIGFLKEQLKLLEDWQLDQKHILECLVIFARGGYGRGELSFASDLDIGYCLNAQRLNAAEFELLKQLIIRLEHLLNQTGIETSHQYFEIDEDLSRFTQSEMLHTIPSILESRRLLGSESLMDRLKQQFFEILPYESYVLSKLEYYHSAKRPELNRMDLKEDFGGLRSVQIPLWVAAATLGVFPSQTAELLALLIEKNILSPRQTLQLSQALELFYDLRNFVGAAKEFYFDEEAKSEGCSLDGWQANVITDNTEKLYLLRKKRFRGFDEFDRFRLRMVHSVQESSELILNRLLDRDIVRTFSNFQATVNLRKQRIIEIRAIEGLPQIPLSLIFNKPARLLDLFIYIGHSGYKLSNALKDEMGNVINSLTPELIESHRSEIQERFTEIMISPHAALALRAMFEIDDPANTQKEADTLIGRFIPECNQMRFLLRNLSYHQYAVCDHTLRALERTQVELEYLKKNYTELFHYLQPKHILALRWGMLFHDIGKINPETKHQESGTAIAVNALERIGYEDEELLNLVSLLIFHHMTIVALSRTSTYLDQALQRFFEVADRDLTRMILLFLVNISDYAAVSETTAMDTKNLRNFFEDTYRAYIELRASTDAKDPLELINIYLDNQKQELEAATRINLLIYRSLNEGMLKAIYEPLSQINPQEYTRLWQVKEELEQYWKYLKMGSLDKKGIDQYTDKLIQGINQYVSHETLIQLTAETEKTFNWFFNAFPNRYLLGQSPDMLRQKLVEFAEFESRSIFSTIATQRGNVVGTLIYVHDQPKILNRVAFGMSTKNINIKLAKMNKVIFEDGRMAYCYYFEASGLTNNMMFARTLEETILEGTLPVLTPEPLNQVLFKSRLRLEFMEKDDKAYEVVQEGERFVRRNREFRVVRITTQDAHLLYYKITEAFDRVGVSIQQALVTTTGTQVNDYFYVTEEDFAILKSSKFEEILKLGV